MWINFWTLFFWLTILLFFLNLKNFLLIVFYSELVWVILYIHTITCGVSEDNIVLSTMSFFLLAFAGLEFSVGFLIIILFRNFKKSLDLSFVPNCNKITTHNKIYFFNFL